MTDTPMTPEYEREIRSHVAEMSNYTLGNLFARDLLAEVDRLRTRVAELEALKPARFQVCQVCGAGYEYGKPCWACEFKKQMAAETGPRRDLRSGAAAARRLLRRPGACFTCGDVPDEWCPDCACCKAGCDGGHTNNPCTHPNAPWNTEPTP
ncbi:hypothetical protein G6W57_00875 [Streptomyces sp. CAI-121]|uniref:hypothetical protein n=1 Tax=unclassified Streptomyces TaxID=2593676 RepID=UPI001587E38A|nr:MULTISPECIES: hypothetical protein [unclassified Streptomyces]NUV65668.1 hypothetical protein [Streptomyces sp. CAI-121]NUW12405.1 hypothetical protein [Streptomyces sp. CAI-68]